MKEVLNADSRPQGWILKGIRWSSKLPLSRIWTTNIPATRAGTCASSEPFADRLRHSYNDVTRNKMSEHEAVSAGRRSPIETGKEVDLHDVQKKTDSSLVPRGTNQHHGPAGLCFRRLRVTREELSGSRQPNRIES